MRSRGCSTSTSGVTTRGLVATASRIRLGWMEGGTGSAMWMQIHCCLPIRWDLEGWLGHLQAHTIRGVLHRARFLEVTYLAVRYMRRVPIWCRRPSRRIRGLLWTCHAWCGTARVHRSAVRPGTGRAQPTFYLPHIRRQKLQTGVGASWRAEIRHTNFRSVQRLILMQI